MLMISHFFRLHVDPPSVGTQRKLCLHSQLRLTAGSKYQSAAKASSLLGCSSSLPSPTLSLFTQESPLWLGKCQPYIHPPWQRHPQMQG